MRKAEIKAEGEMNNAEKENKKGIFIGNYFAFSVFRIPSSAFRLSFPPSAFPFRLPSSSFRLKKIIQLLYD